MQNKLHASRQLVVAVLSTLLALLIAVLASFTRHTIVENKIQIPWGMITGNTTALLTTLLVTNWRYSRVLSTFYILFSLTVFFAALRYLSPLWQMASEASIISSGVIMFAITVIEAAALFLIALTLLSVSTRKA